MLRRYGCLQVGHGVGRVVGVIDLDQLDLAAAEDSALGVDFGSGRPGAIPESGADLGIDARHWPLHTEDDGVRASGTCAPAGTRTAACGQCETESGGSNYRSRPSRDPEWGRRMAFAVNQLSLAGH